MNIKHCLLTITTIMLLVVMSHASAASMRCGVHLIQDGSRTSPGKYEILKKCGDPVDQYGNTWIYDIAGSRYVLTFKDNSQLKTIRR